MLALARGASKEQKFTLKEESINGVLKISPQLMGIFFYINGGIDWDLIFLGLASRPRQHKKLIHSYLRKMLEIKII